MAGGKTNPSSLLSAILKKRIDVTAARAALEAWKGRDQELLRYAKAASRHMPPGIDINGTIYFVTGYDIGVACPPDVAINIAHPHFTADPSEVGHYVTHEVHHLAFLARRRMPSLARLRDREVMRSIIEYMTHMEGMAVHSAYAGRVAANALGADDDYLVYRHKTAAEKSIAGYADIKSLTRGSGELSGPQVNTILSAMSSGGRLWYRFGALVARRVERRHGTMALALTMDDPFRFREAARSLLSHGGSSVN